MNYGEVFSSAGRLVWNRRVIWLIGMMAAFFGQGGFGYGVNYSQSVPTPSGSGPLAAPGMEQLMRQLTENFILYAVLLGGLSLLWALLALFLGWLAIGAIISMAAQEEMSWRAAFSSSRAHLGRLVLIAIVLGLPLFVLVIIGVAIGFVTIGSLFTTALANEGTPEDFLTRIFGAMACLFPLFGLGFLLNIVLRGINLFAARACLLEDLAVGASISRGWQILKSNLGYSLLNGLILFAIGVVFGIVAAIPGMALLFMSAPKMLDGIWDTQVMLGLGALIVYSLIMNVVVAGVLTSFAETLWTKMYLAFVGKHDLPSDATPSIIVA